MKIFLVVAHPRQGSLTHQAASAFARAAAAGGHEVETADLVAEDFDPVLREPDEPDWADPARVYSPAVRAEMARIERNEATVMLFPVWWWSVPAVLKGWIDRVWNNGWAYGSATYPHRRALMIAIAGNTEESFRKRGYDEAMKVQLETGVLRYCGVEEARLEILYGALEGPGEAQDIVRRAHDLGAAF